MRRKNDTNAKGEIAKHIQGDDFIFWAALDGITYRKKYKELLAKKKVNRSKINRINVAKKRKNNPRRKSPKIEKLNQDDIDRLTSVTGYEYRNCIDTIDSYLR